MRAARCMAVAAAATRPCGLPRGSPAPDPAVPPSITRVVLAPEGQERLPVTVPTEPENTVELDFPWPVGDWAGRGFTPDAEKFAGDFVIEAVRGRERVFVTPVVAGAHRVLHVVLMIPGGGSRGVPVEFIPAPAGLAWRKVVFADEKPPQEAAPEVSLEQRAPGSRYRDPSPESELGLVATLRLLLSTTAAGARALAAANPALELGVPSRGPRSFGNFTLTTRFALRDSTTDSLGICVAVANTTQKRLVFDPTGWVVRVGQRAYPVRTVDFPGELEPGAEAIAFLVLGRSPDGGLTLLLPENDFEVSAVLMASVNPRPVRRMPLPGFDTP